MGHVVSASGVLVDPEKAEVVMIWERPKSVFEIISFLGLAGYYRRFIEDFSQLAATMTRLTGKGVKSWYEATLNPKCLFLWTDRVRREYQKEVPITSFIKSMVNRRNR